MQHRILFKLSECDFEKFLCHQSSSLERLNSWHISLRHSRAMLSLLSWDTSFKWKLLSWVLYWSALCLETQFYHMTKYLTSKITINFLVLTCIFCLFCLFSSFHMELVLKLCGDCVIRIFRFLSSLYQVSASAVVARNSSVLHIGLTTQVMVPVLCIVLVRNGDCWGCVNIFKQV